MENQSLLKSCAAVKRFEGSKAFMFSKECFDLLSNDPRQDSPSLNFLLVFQSHPKIILPQMQKIKS